MSSLSEEDLDRISRNVTCAKQVVPEFISAPTKPVPAGSVLHSFLENNEPSYRRRRHPCIYPLDITPKKNVENVRRINAAKFSITNDPPKRKVQARERSISTNKKRFSNVRDGSANKGKLSSAETTTKKVALHSQSLITISTSVIPKKAIHSLSTSAEPKYLQKPPATYKSMYAQKSKIPTKLPGTATRKNSIDPPAIVKQKSKVKFAEKYGKSKIPKRVAFKITQETTNGIPNTAANSTKENALSNLVNNLKEISKSDETSAPKPKNGEALLNMEADTSMENANTVSKPSNGEIELNTINTIPEEDSSIQISADLTESIWKKFTNAIPNSIPNSTNNEALPDMVNISYETKNGSVECTRNSANDEISSNTVNISRGDTNVIPIFAENPRNGDAASITVNISKEDKAIGDANPNTVASKVNTNVSNPSNGDILLNTEIISKEDSNGISISDPNPANGDGVLLNAENISNDIPNSAPNSINSDTVLHSVNLSKANVNDDNLISEPNPTNNEAILNAAHICKENTIGNPISDRNPSKVETLLNTVKNDANISHENMEMELTKLLRVSLAAREGFIRDLQRQLKKGYNVLQERYKNLFTTSSSPTEEDVKTVLTSHAKFLYWINHYCDGCAKDIHKFETEHLFNGEKKRGSKFFLKTSIVIGGKEVTGVFIPIPNPTRHDEHKTTHVN